MKDVGWGEQGRGLWEIVGRQFSERGNRSDPICKGTMAGAEIRKGDEGSGPEGSAENLDFVLVSHHHETSQH